MADVDLNELATYHPHGMIATQLFPVVRVVHERDYYYAWDFGTEPGATLREYHAQEFAHTVQGATMAHLHRAQDLVLLDQEIRIARLATDPANYPVTNRVTLAGSRQWNNKDTACIDEDIQTGRKAIQAATGGLLPNTIVIPRLVARSMSGSAPLPEVVEGMRVLIASTTYVDGEKFVDVWGNNVLLAFVAPGMALDQVTLGLIFRSQPWRVTEVSDAAAMRVSIEQAEKLIAPSCGYLIRNVVA